MQYTVRNLDTGVTTEVDSAKAFAEGNGNKATVTIITDPVHPLSQMLGGKMSPQDYLAQRTAKKGEPEPK